MFVSAGVDLKFHNLPIETSDLIYKPMQKSNIKSLSWSKDNCFLTFVSENAKPEIISLKNLDNIKNVHTISAVTGASAISFQRTTKRYIGLGTNSGQTALYDTKSKAINKLFETAPCPVNLLDFNADDKQMAVSCVNGTVLLYDTKKTNIHEIYSISNISHSTTMRFHPKELHLLTIGTEDGVVTQWDVDVGQSVFSAQIHSATVKGLVVVENLNSVVSVSSDHKFCIHDIITGESVFRSNLPHPLTAVDASPNGLTVAVGNIYGNIYIYDTRQLMMPINVAKPHNTQINKILFEHKPIDDFDGDFSEVHSTCCQDKQEVFIKHEDKSAKQIAEEYEEKPPNIKIPCTVKCNLESLSKRITHNEPAIAKSLKEEVADSIYKSTEELRAHLMQQIGSLHNVITNEFHLLEDQMEEKWNLLNLAITSVKDIQSKESLKNLMEL